ncbi:MAG: long-chain fatty acid--CoA ligase [Acidimicrobiia bacterium]|nr:long-chain fatty acid--CoA ligase [Acidimicrobiia bacterium]
MTMRPAIPAALRLDQAVRAQSAARPEADAVSQQGTSLTYSELVTAIDRYAVELVSAGVRPGDRVAVRGHSRIECLVAMFAASSIGGAYLGLNAKYTYNELEFIVKDAEPRIFIDAIEGVTDSIIQKLERSGLIESWFTLSETDFGRPLPSLIASLNSQESQALVRIREKVTPNDVAAILYTSGSTGRPKGAMLTHRGLLLGTDIMARLLGGRPRTLTDYAINHVAWLTETCMMTLAVGGTLFMVEKFDAASTLELIEREALNLWEGSPAMIMMCIETPNFESADLSSVDYVWPLGGPLSPDAVRLLHERTGGAVVTAGFGMTETSGGYAFTAPEDSVETLVSTVGRPDKTVQVKIVDENGSCVPDGEPGEVLVKGDVVFPGYLNMPKETEELFDADGFLQTGDIAYQRHDGALVLVGRIGDMFKSGGYNVYPAEVETVLAEYPAVTAAAVLSRTDSKWGEVGIAFLASGSGKSVDPAQIAAWCKERLANYKVPKEFEVRDQLPMLGSGKVDKATLRGLINDESESS